MLEERIEAGDEVVGIDPGHRVSQQPQVVKRIERFNAHTDYMVFVESGGWWSYRFRKVPREQRTFFPPPIEEKPKEVAK